MTNFSIILNKKDIENKAIANYDSNKKCSLEDYKRTFKQEWLDGVFQDYDKKAKVASYFENEHQIIIIMQNI